MWLSMRWKIWRDTRIALTMVESPGAVRSMRRRFAPHRRAADGDAAIRLFKGRRVVYAVAGHRDDMADRLKAP
jgi:hypothetical protein